MNVSEAVAYRIREILDKKHLSIYWLSNVCGLSAGTINSLLYNRYDGVNLKTVFVIIQALDITVLDFFNSPLFEDLYNINLD